MPSASLQRWRTARVASLDEVEAAHASLGGTGRGRRYATQQVNYAYVVLLSSQFQGFCRDLHSESALYLSRQVAPESLQTVFLSEFLRDLKLKTGSPNPGNLGADFGRLGIDFWDAVKREGRRTPTRKAHLEALNKWRNAIAHQDFDPSKLLGTTANNATVRLSDVKRWRASCEGLAMTFDVALRRHLCQHVAVLLAAPPWH